MNINQASKFKCLFIAIAILLNPIFVSADALFSGKSTSSVISSFGSAEMPANCRDKNMTDSQQEMSNSTECCDIPCECGASGCNLPTAMISFNQTSFFISTFSHSYLRDSYLSFISSPSFPPPII